MAIGFNIQFRVNPTTQSYIIRLTDTSTGFTLSKGNFVINYPDGSIRHYVDFNTPDISAPLGSVDIPAPIDTTGSVLRGSYTISYITLDSSLTQRELVQTFNFNWIAPTVTIKNLSDSALPEVKFQDVTAYTPVGSFTGAVTSRTFSVAMPTTSAVSGSTPTTSGATLDAVVSANYYEGVYTPSLSTVITYTHTSISGLTVLLTSVTTKTFAIKKAPTRNELVARINAFRAIIDGYKELNDTQFEILSEQYDILMALYFHLIERAYSSTLDGSQDILNEILSILDPYTAYTYQSGQISAFYISPLGSGTVTSVALTTPTGLTTTGSPITSSGTLAISLSAGYSIPTTAKQSNWDDSYTFISSFPSQTGNSGRFLTTNGSVLSWVANSSGTVNSVGLSAPTGFSVAGTPVTTSGTLALSFAAGYSLPSDATQATWTAKQDAINGTGFVKATGTSIFFDNSTYFPYPAGTTSQYVAGDGSLITFPINTQSGALVRLVRNKTGATLTKGTVVYIDGATGNNPTVAKAQGNTDATSAQTFGLCQANISNNATGYVVVAGDLIGLDTSSFTEGAQLYLSPTLAGTYTTTKQYAPNHLVYIGVVTRSHPNLGQIEVKIQNGYEMDELHNVDAFNPSNNDGIFYNSTTNLWEHKPISTVLGYTPSNDSLVVHLAGTETITGAKTFRGTTASDTAPLGSELAAVTAGGTNWAVVGTNLNAGGYSHTAGSTADLTTSLAAVSGTYYQITYTITNRTAGSITINYGGIVVSGISASGNTGPLASSTAALTITPTTDFNGTVALSIKSIGTSSATTTFANSSGATAMEIRASSDVSNTFIGINTGSRFNSVLTSFNTFIGANAGQNNTTGNSNIFVGNSVGQSNNIGSRNVAVGGFALNTIGSFNTAIGFGALDRLISGNNNTAIGYLAGRNISGGSINSTIQNESVFVGNATKPLADNQTNQVVIGHNVTGLGSNTTVLGNSSTTTTAIYGNLLLGSTTDTGEKLQVTGSTIFKSLAGASDRVIYVTSTGVVTAATIGSGLSFSAGTLSATGTASGSIGGSGTAGVIPKFTGTAAIGNSNITDTGSLISLGSNSYVNGNLSVGTTTTALINYGREIIVSSTSGQPEGFFVVQGNTSTANTNIGGLSFYNLTNNIASIIGKRQAANNSGLLSFNTVNLGTSSEKMVLTSTGSLGLGTNNPNPNSIYGTAFTILSSSGYGGIEIMGSGTINGGQIDFGTSTSFVKHAVIAGEFESSDNGFFKIMTRISGAITEKFRIFSNGNTTIQNGGTFTNAGFRLDVAGSTRFQGTTASDTAPLGAEIATTGSGTNWTGTAFSTGYTHTVGSTANLTDSSVAVIGTTYRVSLTITGRTAGSVSIFYGGETYISNRTTSIILARQAITTAGLVVTPTSDFDGTVVFSINSVGNSSASITFSNSSGVVVTEMRGSNSFSNNLFIGINAGRKSVVVSNSNIQNTFIGNGSGQNNSNGRFNTFVGFECGANNSAGDSLTAIGTSALINNTTGSFSIAMGQGALGSNTTGGLNSGLGHSALNSNTTGGNNVGVGQAALSLNTTGSNNIAIGVNAGRNIASGSGNTITNTSIYIGENTRASADNQTNQIVIGHQTIGLGSNTTILGNSSTVTTAIYGDILLGGTTPITSALLAMTSTTEGFLPPRMTTSQKNAISSPATGLVVFDTTLGKLCVFSTTWQTITSV